MVKEDDVFVITEDDILKPAERLKGRAAARGGPATVTRMPEKTRSAGGDADPAVATSMVGRNRGARSTNPAAAGTLSLWVWGLGQFYNGDTKLAALFVLCEILVVAFHYMLHEIWDSLCQFSHLFFISEWELVLYVSALDFCLIFFMIYNVSQAYRAAESRGSRFNGLQTPVVSALASMLVPGWGQMLNGQLRKGAVFLFAFLVQAYLITLYMLSPFYRIVIDLDPREILLRKAIWGGMAVLFLTALSWLISAYDAMLVARYKTSD
jgi:hypothetical protein